MKKTLTIVTILLLVSGSLTVLAQTPIKNQNITIIATETIPNFVIENFDKSSVEIQIPDSSTYIMSPGYPMLPKRILTYELPFGINNIKVTVTPDTIASQSIQKPIRPAPTPLPLTSFVQTEIKELMYHQKDLSSFTEFPETWFSYSTGCGLNDENKHITYVIIELYPIKYHPQENLIENVNKFDITLTYSPSSMIISPSSTNYDMVIITPQKFSNILQPFIEHKNNFGVETYVKTTEEIYSEYTGVDKPEQIKYFIKDAIETHNITYVLLVGGLKSLLWSKPRDDLNQGVRGWHVPVRYNNLYDDPEHPLLASSIYDPGVITDLYYADIYETGGNFSTWDPNGDGIFAAMSRPNVENDTGIDMYPDVILGRLACRNTREVKLMTNKIIKYESTPADPSWFKKMIVISGDGFLDQQDLDIQWDITSFPDGDYTIYAQSNNPYGDFGPIDVINITIDRTKETNISFNHDDHLKIDSYPAPPIAEITSPSEGDILGNTDYFYEPRDSEAYCNEFTGWGNVSFENNTMHIRGKSYDPQPYGNVTDIHVWITNDLEEIVFSDWRNNTEMYYEGEWVTGAKSLQGQGGALYYMPPDFEHKILWTSNGNLTGKTEVIEALSEGAGFVFFSGHGSPRVWGDHYPGVPGNRRHASITGLVTMYLRGNPPLVPIEQIKNFNKPYVMVVGGCHNSQFNVSIVPSLLDYYLPLYMWTYGSAAPECFSWWMTRLSSRGAIASIGNTGLGYGTLGKDCTISGLDGGISRDFFRQYSVGGHHILGDAYSQTITDYLGTYDMEEDDHIKSVHQWVLLGDPSLMIGGYQ